MSDAEAKRPFRSDAGPSPETVDRLLSDPCLGASNAMTIDESAGADTSNAMTLDESPGAGASNALTMDESSGMNASNAMTFDESAEASASNAMTLDESTGANASNAVTLDESAGASVSNAMTFDESAGAGASNAMTFDESAGASASNAMTLDESAGAGASNAMTLDESVGASASNAMTLDESAGADSSNAMTLDDSASDTASNARTLDDAPAAIAATLFDDPALGGGNHPVAPAAVTIVSTIVAAGQGPLNAQGKVNVEDIRRDWADLHQNSAASSTATAVQVADPQSRQTATVNVALRQGQLTPALHAGPRDAYAVTRRLGLGGMGAVFRARQQSLNRDVAVKVILPDHAKNERSRAKFIAEAVITGALDHPNIIPLHELGVTGEGHMFYAMKEVKGREWEDVIQQKSEEENIDILLRVADAIAFAHDRGIIHRDLKPQNVMLGDYGEVLVMDWGLAVPFLPGERGERVAMGRAGTPAYMPPEMARADDARIGPASDIYLLGAMLYQFATGKLPHTGPNLHACIAAAANNVITPADRHDELVDIAMKAMAHRPEDRYATVKDFQDALRGYRRHQESVVLTRRAAEHLEQARATGRYDAYNQAVFGYSEALVLWDHNEDARRGRRVAQLALVERALAQGDYDLALNAASAIEDLPTSPGELPASAPAPANASADARKQTVAPPLTVAAFAGNVEANRHVASLRERARHAKAENVARANRIQRLRRLAITLLAVVVAVLAVGVALVSMQYSKAEEARREADIKRQEAEDAKQVAEAKRQEAEEARKFEAEAKVKEAQERLKAENATKEAVAQRLVAEEAKAAAEKSEKMAEERRVLAEEAKREAEERRVAAEKAEKEAVDARAVAEERRLAAERAKAETEAARVREVAAANAQLKAVKDMVAAQAEAREKRDALAQAGVLEDAGRWTFPPDEALRRQETAARDAGLPVRLVLTLPGDVPMTLIAVPPSNDWIMGSSPKTETAAGRGADEFLHPVHLANPYWMAETEITRAQWRALVPVEPKERFELGHPLHRLVEDFKDHYTDGWDWRVRPLEDGEGDRAASGISYRDIVDIFLPALQRLAPEGRAFRLPTEAEWEWAARAGTATPYYTGATEDDARRAGWIDESEFNEPQPVRQKTPNAFGLHDMVGNVAEITEDYHADDFYRTGRMEDPRNDEDLAGRRSRVIRGGSYEMMPSRGRSAARWSAYENNRVAVVGARPVLSIPWDAIDAAARARMDAAAAPADVPAPSVP